MTTTYLNSSPSPFPVMPREDQQHQLHTAKAQVSSSSSLSGHVFTYSIQDQGGCYHRGAHQLEYQQEANYFASQGGSRDHPRLDSESDQRLKFSLWKKEDGHENGSDQTDSVKWMSSKMRLMRRMRNTDRVGTEAPTNAQMKFDQDQKQPSSPLETCHSSNSSSSNSNNPIRVCADCKTTKTPLWRSGPRGPKSLCNACGIRQRKARRAMAAAAAAANGTILAAETPSVKTKVQHKGKRSKKGYDAQHKKRSKLATTSHGSRKKLCFEEFLISLSKNLAFHRVFPQDEKEAAILLMALSCGLVRG